MLLLYSFTLLGFPNSLLRIADTMLYLLTHELFRIAIVPPRFFCWKHKETSRGPDLPPWIEK